MNGYILAAIIAVLSYLIGSVNFSIMLSRMIGKKDIRESGSGNAGATNMLRTYGKKMGVITLLLDVAKGIAAILLTMLIVKLYAEYMTARFTDSGQLPMSTPIINLMALKYISGVSVILGHNFPLYFGFKGGKGVATSLGVVLMLDWKVGLIVMVIALAIMALTRYVSLGSIVGGAAFIILETISIISANMEGVSGISQIARLNTTLELIFEYNPDIINLICVLIIGGLLIARHHANIKRLLNGTENKLGAKKEK